jgi:hypothetical protein
LCAFDATTLYLRHPGAEGQLRDYWSRLVRFAEEHPAEARYLETTPLGHPLDAASETLREEVKRRSAERVVAWTRSGEIRPLPIEVVAALVHGTFWRIFLDAPRRARRSMLDKGRDAVWSALQRVPAEARRDEGCAECDPDEEQLPDTSPHSH